MTGAGYYDVKISGAVADSHPVPWTQRGPRQCTWPIGEGADLKSCCAPVAPGRGSWCAEHSLEGRRPTDDDTLDAAVAEAMGPTGERRAETAAIVLALPAIPPAKMARIMYAARQQRVETAIRRAA